MDVDVPAILQAVLIFIWIVYIWESYLSYRQVRKYMFVNMLGIYIGQVMNRMSLSSYHFAGSSIIAQSYPIMTNNALND